MTAEELKQYQAIKAEIEDLEKRIADLKKPEVVQLGTVKGSSKRFPYTPATFTVAGIDPAVAKQREKEISGLLRKWEVQKDEQAKKLAEIEQFIADISDSRTRQIFRMRYIDGMKVNEIAKRVGYTHGRISQKISRYLKD